jgi:hypothetical protein
MLKKDESFDLKTRPSSVEAMVNDLKTRIIWKKEAKKEKG